MRWLALGGAAAPLLFASTVLVCASLRPDYSHVSQFISELGATGTPHAALMNYLGFIPTGLLLVGFGASLAWVFPRRRLTIAAAILLTFFGAGIAVCGLASCDVGCPQSGGTVANTIHDRLAPLSFLAAIVGMLVLGVRFRRSGGAWGSLWIYSVASSGLGLLLLMVLAGSLQTRVLTGLWQRLLLGVLLLWTAIVGARAFRLSGSSAPG